MAAPITVNDMLDQVRDQIDEKNTEDISDTDILQALNRGQRRLIHIVARKEDEIFLDYKDITTTSGTREILVPRDSYGSRIEMVELITSGVNKEIRRMSRKNTQELDSGSSTTNQPWGYTRRGNYIRLHPFPNAGLTIRVWYTKKPPQLVLSQGRVIDVDSGNNTITVDSVGTDLDTTVEDLAAFVNIVDGQTGEIKNSLQISALDDDSGLITFKSASLDRSTVYGTDIETSIATDVAEDDYVCSIGGTAVPATLSDYSDFIIAYAVLEIKRRLNVATDAEFAAMKDHEEEVKKIWVGREQAARIERRNKHWGVRTGSYFRRFLS